MMGEERFSLYLKSFEQDVPVSIRLNPLKTEGLTVADGERIPWCRQGFYLPKRPNFTFDPLLHAGCYYVQEASSMFLHEVLSQHLPQHPVAALDMCAAPGGKSTLMRSMLAEGSVLYANEPVRTRAHVLAENIEKWGYADCIVTNNYPSDYRKAKMRFDVILCDVPCSGEGMFRKDEATIREWSVNNVEKCWRLQREIVADAWQCLNEGGLMIYSTCTFNTKENEENIRWMLSEFDAEALEVETQREWGITGSLLAGFSAPVYRFIPGIVKGEGLFLCALRKAGNTMDRKAGTKVRSKQKGAESLCVIPPSNPTDLSLPKVEVDFRQALAYLRHEALTLPEDTPRGLVEVCFQGHPLGQAKHIGTRANNLYPKEWKIKTTHIPNDYEAILRHT